MNIPKLALGRMRVAHAAFVHAEAVFKQEIDACAAALGVVQGSNFNLDTGKIEVPETPADPETPPA